MQNWHGYLANITILTTGRLTFEFAYPADRCCQNILFYSENQAAIINARMNCWQKEYLLRPEEDQILRLTPRFAWSGCNMVHPNGVATFVCEGGRSFTVDHPPPPGPGEHFVAAVAAAATIPGPSTWYIAVSNCATLQGLDLKYRLAMYGHIGDCPTVPVPTTPSISSSLPVPAPRASLVPRQASSSSQNKDGSSSSSGSSSGVGADDGSSGGGDSGSVCVFADGLNTTVPWYGFLANISLAAGGGFRFRFTTADARPSTTHILLYNDDDVARLSAVASGSGAAELSCWQREGLISPNRVADQIIDLSPTSSWNGCAAENRSFVVSGSQSGGGGGSSTVVARVLTCRGERRYYAPRRLYVAASNCRSPTGGLALDYRLEVFGFDGDLCSGAGSAPTRWRTGTAFGAVLFVTVFTSSEMLRVVLIR